MRNLKCENVFKHVQSNVAIAGNSWICQQLNCKRLLIVSNLDIIWFNLKTPKFFSRWLWTSFLRNLLCLKIFVLRFCSIGLLYFYTRVLHRKVAASKYVGQQLFWKYTEITAALCGSSLAYTRVIYLKSLRRTILQK